MNKAILPSKAQPGDEVTYELGTTEAIKAFVKAVKFDDRGEICYDLAIEREPRLYVSADNIASGCITVVKASAYQEPNAEPVESKDSIEFQTISRLHCALTALNRNEPKDVEHIIVTTQDFLRQSLYKRLGVPCEI